MAKISGKIYDWCAFKIDTFIDNDDCDELRALADRIDAEMVELPRDRDGVPIHVGDTVYDENGMAYEVVSFSFGRWPGGVTVHAVDDSSKWRDLMPGRLAHTAPDSLERIADELDKWCDRVDVDGDACEKPRALAERIRKLAAKEG